MFINKGKYTLEVYLRRGNLDLAELMIKYYKDNVFSNKIKGYEFLSSFIGWAFTSYVITV